jgi:NAD(P)-dependent dehydrogenase (short-subunit alcohol dehydrogenase family)
VVLAARNASALQQLADDIHGRGGRAYALAGDVQDEAAHAQWVAAAQREFGGLDIAINNAGTVGPLQPLADLAPAQWQQILNTNLTAAYLGARSQIPAMLDRGGGALVFTSSFVGTSVGLPGMAAYGASKAGLMGLVKGITADYAAQGIRANALLPGGTDTAMAGDPAQKDWAARLHAMKRLAQADEIAAAALFLASPMASFVTGSALFADGGNAAVK